MMRLFAGLLCLITAYSSAWAQTDTESGKTAKDAVKTFYQWYIETNNKGIDPLETKDIYQWVNPKLVNRLRSDRKAGLSDGDGIYFLETQDPDPYRNWANNLVVVPVAEVSGEMIIKVIFPPPQSMQLCVHANEDDKVWKITQVDDSNLDSEFLTCRLNEAHIFSPPL